MKRYIHSSEDIFCMSNVRGSRVKCPGRLPFSFYFSGKNGQHGIRVKPVWNPDKMKESEAGNLQLHGDWIYVPGKDDKHVKNSDVESMKSFFRDYIVLFAAVWDGQLYDTTVQDYFEGVIGLNNVIEEFDFYMDYKDELDKISSIQELEDFCRENDLVNLHGN